MSETFAEKLAFVLKALSMSRARLAADLKVNKSAVGRWVTGAVEPTPHNLSQLSVLMAQRVPGFTALDWDRDIESLATLFGVEPGVLPSARAFGLRGGPPLPLLGQILAKTALLGAVYEGFYRSTRPFAAMPGRFVHDHCMVRRDDTGLLRLSMASGGVFVDGWVLPLHDRLFIMGSEFTSGTLVFAILHGVEDARAQVLDGLTLTTVHDVGRTPTASPIVLERIGEVSDDQAADEARFMDLAAREPVAPEGSVPPALVAHLARDIGPRELARGGDWLLRAPASRSVSRGGKPS